MKDIRDFPWLVFIITAAYYMALFPFLDVISYACACTFVESSYSLHTFFLRVYLRSKYGIHFFHLNFFTSFVYLIPIATLPIVGFLADKIGFNLLWGKSP